MPVKVLSEHHHYDRQNYHFTIIVINTLETRDISIGVQYGGEGGEGKLPVLRDTFITVHGNRLSRLNVGKKGEKIRRVDRRVVDYSQVVR